MAEIAFPRPLAPAADRAESMRRWRISRPGTPPWDMARAELLHTFGGREGRGRPDRIVMAWFVRSTLASLAGAIARGDEPGVIGNLRTLWYRYVRPAAMRAHPDGEDKDSYRVTITQLNRMVFEWRLLEYRGFDLTDDYWEARRIGTTRPEVLVACEKQSQVRFLREVHQRTGATTLAWSGAPPGVTVENTARHAWAAMRSRGRAHLPFRILALVDYDPEGHVIAGELERSLTQLGFETELHHIVTPDHLTQAEIGYRKLPLTRRAVRNRTLLERWLARTGGVAGEPYRIRLESLPRARRLSLIEERM